jgi:hypothetical protein
MREQPAHDLRSCVAVIDRFLDGKPSYPLEWDDFVSWPHDSPGIEAVRLVIAPTEQLFFSKDLAKRQEGAEIVLAERNRIAAIAGIPMRSLDGGPAGNAT